MIEFNSYNEGKSVQHAILLNYSTDLIGGHDYLEKEMWFSR